MGKKNKTKAKTDAICWTLSCNPNVHRTDASVESPGGDTWVVLYIGDYGYIRAGGGAVQVWELTNYFGQFLSPQWNTGEFCADSAESSTQDPLGLFAVGRVGLKRG